MHWQKLIRNSVLILFFGIGIFPGCGDDFNECSTDGIPKYFDVFDLEAQHTRGDAFSFELLSNGSSVIFENYRGVHILPNVNLYGSVEEHSFFYDMSWANFAMAATLVPAGYGGSETEMLTGLDIMTVNDYDADHPAGSNVNDISSVRIGARNFTIDEYVSQKENLLIQIEDLPYVIRPNTAPQIDSNIQFMVTLELSTGEAYTATTGEIIIIEN